MSSNLNWQQDRHLLVCCKPDGMKAPLKDSVLNSLARLGLVEIKSRHATYCVWLATEAGRKRAGMGDK